MAKKYVGVDDMIIETGFFEGKKKTTKKAETKKATKKTTKKK